jgi:hypothetical protein
LQCIRFFSKFCQGSGRGAIIYELQEKADHKFEALNARLSPDTKTDAKEDNRADREKLVLD